MQEPLVSIITVAFHSIRTLETAIKSVLSQTYSNIEYIVVDGMSNDGTVELLKRYEPDFNGRLRWISEKDNGIYDAMNKGFRMATGDVVGILNSDDYFTSTDVVEKLVPHFEDSSLDAVYGDIHFIRDGEPDKCVRYYSSRRFSPGWLRFGFMPAHPSFYARREVFDRAGLYKTNYKIGSDYEMMVRLFFKYKIKAKYLPLDFVTMRLGGLSTRNARSRLQLIKDDVRGCRENGIYTNALMISVKFLFKIFELKP
ncbi:MAG: glycosyltransferase [Bacteroidaceae bacterium]|nr:glycosyltransferase [Bacteroidaceae bacterium]